MKLKIYLLGIFTFLLFLNSQAQQTNERVLPPPVMEDPRFLVTRTENNKNLILLELPVENVFKIEVTCFDNSSKKIVKIDDPVISIDTGKYNLKNPYTAKIHLIDPNKEYLYIFTAKQNSLSTTAIPYNYYPIKPVDPIIYGSVKYVVTNDVDLKVEYVLNSTPSILTTYGYCLKIKQNGFEKIIKRDKIANANGFIIFPDVFNLGNDYKVNFEVGINENNTREIQADEALKTGPPLDFETYPSIVFYNDGKTAGIKLKFNTTQSCMSVIKINSAGSKEKMLTIDDGKAMNGKIHDREISSDLNFMTDNKGESVAYIQVDLVETDRAGNTVKDSAGKEIVRRSAKFGLGGSQSVSANTVTLDKKEKSIETAKKIGNALGSGLKALVKTVLPIPF